MQLGPGGSTAVTAIVVDGKDLWVANIGDSRAVVCERGSANQLTVDHEPHSERRRIEKQGGFVTNLPGKDIYFIFIYLIAYHVYCYCSYYCFYFLFFHFCGYVSIYNDRLGGSHHLYSLSFTFLNFYSVYVH